MNIYLPTILNILIYNPETEYMNIYGILLTNLTEIYWMDLQIEKFD